MLPRPSAFLSTAGIGRLRLYGHQIDTEVVKPVKQPIQVRLVTDLADEDGLALLGFQHHPVEDGLETFTQSPAKDNAVSTAGHGSAPTTKCLVSGGQPRWRSYGGAHGAESNSRPPPPRGRDAAGNGFQDGAYQPVLGARRVTDLDVHLPRGAGQPAQQHPR
jgi:hypothetical protein